MSSQEKKPLTLARRLTLAVLAIGLLAVLLQALALHFWLTPLRDQKLQLTTQQLQVADQLLSAAPAAERVALARRLEHEELRLQRLAQWPARNPAGEPGFGPAATIRETVGRQLPPGHRLWTAPRSDGKLSLFVAWRLSGTADDIWQAEFIAAPPLLQVGLTLSSWVLVMAFLAFAALVVSVRLVTRPLERLAAALAAQRGALQPLPHDPQASREMHDLVQAFNRLAGALQAAQRERQALLAGVSHDLRTPLARLRLRVETQLEGAQAESLDRDLQALQHIVDQFLAYVQGEAQPRPGPKRELGALLQDIVQAYAPQGVQLQLPIDAAQPVSETALRRLLSNLIDNALAHGSAPVQVLLQARPEGGWRLQVQDAGAGLAAADFERLQQPFVREGEHTAAGHCGLGLAIAAQMARQLGGSLHLQQRSAAQPFAIELRF